MQTLDEYIWVFVGCGGTFYTASSYLAVLSSRYLSKESSNRVILIDPDEIEEGNSNRQWPGYDPGDMKVRCADRMLIVFGVKLASRFQEVGDYLDEVTKGQPVLAIVNVDNDQTRLDVASWLEKRVSPGIMVVSGCERDHGQAYPGIWMDGEPVYDWRKIHTDVGLSNEIEAGRACRPQTVQANALTGVLVGMCIEDIAQRLASGNSLRFIREYFWETGHPRLLNMWSTVVDCEKEVVS